MKHDIVDIERAEELIPFLIEERIISKNEQADTLVLEGGVSNKTVLVQLKSKPSIVVKQALEKLRVKVEWYSSPERIHREAEGLRWLTKIIPDNVPSFLLENHEQHIFGMSAVPAPHENWKTLLLNGECNTAHAEAFGNLLAQIHNAVEVHPQIKTIFNDRSFFESLRIEPYYSYTVSQVPEVKNHIEKLISDTRKRRYALVHGDFSPKNVLVHNSTLYILDYEVIHFGDPTFDVGFALTHFISKAHYLKAYRETFLGMALAFWNAYFQSLSMKHIDQELEQYAVTHTLACMLARVCGRSPLEYLSEVHMSKQKAIVLKLFQNVPNTIENLLTEIKKNLDQE